MDSTDASHAAVKRGCLGLVALALILGPVGCTVPRSDSGTNDAATVREVKSKSGVTLVLLPGGKFEMGNPASGNDAGPAHLVAVDTFAIDKFEVSQAQFAKLEIPDPSQFKDPARPVEQISWVKAAEFCNARSEAEGLKPCYDPVTLACDFSASGYRLPTEAEWEYAARSGQPAARGGTSERHLASRACYAGNSKKKTSCVGEKKPNAWGLHDMLGNVAEWCHDVYAADYYAKSPSSNPRGPATGTNRVIRGGSWKSDAERCGVAVRAGREAGFTDACFTGNTLGFRCVRRLLPAEHSTSPAQQATRARERGKRPAEKHGRDAVAADSSRHQTITPS